MQCNCFCVVAGVGTGLGSWELSKFYLSIFGVDFGKAWIGVMDGGDGGIDCDKVLGDCFPRFRSVSGGLRRWWFFEILFDTFWS